jgi:hypothetical protein
MNEIRGSSLPNAEQIRIAIGTWFRGGGTTNLIVNVCRREMATLAESAALAERLGHRIANGKDFINDEVVSQQLEAVRAVVLSLEEKSENQAKSPNPPVGSDEWHRRASERAVRSWHALMGEVPFPSDPEEAERAYRTAAYARRK